MPDYLRSDNAMPGFRQPLTPGCNLSCGCGGESRPRVIVESPLSGQSRSPGDQR
jgi:hypothetical protein